MSVVRVDGRALEIRHGPGVHRPSAFTQTLIDHLPPVAGAHVVDAGAGAGALTVACLVRDAARVTALDADPEALADTARNVERLADPTRLALVQGQFGALADLPADLVVANPPQRPGRVWRALREDLREEQRVAGEDGLDALRAVLVAAAAPAVWCVLSSLVLGDPEAAARAHGFAARLVAAPEVAHDPVWARAGPLEGARARVFAFERPPAR